MLSCLFAQEDSNFGSDVRDLIYYNKVTALDVHNICKRFQHIKNPSFRQKQYFHIFLEYAEKKGLHAHTRWGWTAKYSQHTD